MAGVDASADTPSEQAHLNVRLHGTGASKKGALAKCAREGTLGEALTDFAAALIATAERIAVPSRDRRIRTRRVVADSKLVGHSLTEVLIAVGHV